MLTKEEVNQIVNAVINEKYPAEYFLNQRNLLDVNSKDFAITNNSNSLTNPNDDLKDKPFVVFSSCPNPLLENVQIKNKEFQEWLEKNAQITLEKYPVKLVSDSKKLYDLESITYNNDYNSRINRYAEFFENGFVEMGFAFPLIHQWKKESTYLNLCRTTGLFWTFLLFVKKFYDLQKFKKTIDVRICVHNSQDLELFGFGGNLKNGNYWANPPGDFYDTSISTHRQNLQIKQTIPIQELTLKNITKFTKSFSDKLSNAFGLEFARCYNYDGSFNFKNFTAIND